MAFDEWADIGKRFAKMSRASAWWLGDWLVYGERTYGKRYKLALEITSLDYQTLRNYAWVARAFPLSRRRDNLSFQHHAEVAGLPEPAQDLWLQRAARSGWSRSELRRQLAGALEPRRKPASSVVRLEVAREREARWRLAAERANQELSDWLAEVADQAAQATS